jgi:hypothetical protein
VVVGLGRQIDLGANDVEERTRLAGRPLAGFGQVAGRLGNNSLRFGFGRCRKRSRDSLLRRTKYGAL